MLRADYSIDCDAAEHGRYRVLAATMAVVYPFGVFAFYTFVLWRRRQLLYPMQVHGRPREDKAIAEEAKRLNELALRPFAILHDACEQGDSACVVLGNFFCNSSAETGAPPCTNMYHHPRHHANNTRGRSRSYQHYDCSCSLALILL